AWRVAYAAATAGHLVASSPAVGGVVVRGRLVRAQVLAFPHRSRLPGSDRAADHPLKGLLVAWYEILGALCLGIGLGLGRFRRKDKTKEPRGKVGAFAAYTLLVAGICGVLTQIGGWSATLGSWLSVSAWLAALVVIAAAGLVATGVVLDLRDGVP